MQSGTLIYTAYDGKTRRLRVRDCPNPAIARALLESLVGSTRWETRRA